MGDLWASIAGAVGTIGAAAVGLLASRGASRASVEHRLARRIAQSADLLKTISSQPAVRHSATEGVRSPTDLLVETIQRDTARYNHAVLAAPVVSARTMWVLAPTSAALGTALLVAGAVTQIGLWWYWVLAAVPSGLAFWLARLGHESAVAAWVPPKTGNTKDPAKVEPLSPGTDHSAPAPSPR